MQERHEDHLPTDGADAPPTYTAPPTHPGAEAAPPSTAWPVAIGVITIVFAGVWAIGSLFTATYYAFLPWFEQLTSSGMGGPSGPQQQQYQQAMQSALQYRWLWFGASIVGFLLCVVLIVAAVKLLQRRVSGARLLDLSALAYVLHGLASAGIAAATTGVQTSGFSPVFDTLILAMSAILGYGWPVFVLIWFRLRKVRAEVSRWRP